MSDRLASGATTEARDFLLELLSEEIPARMQAKARADLARLFAEALQGAGLTTEGIETYSTPRRLALIARGLPEATEAVSEEIKGPRANAPEQALAGFLKKTGLTREQLEERDGVLFAKIDRPGRAASEVLAEAIQSIVRNFPWPKSMRWGSGNLRWVRPLHGIVALLGEEIVPVEVDGVRSGAATLGHRFHHPGIITIGSCADYAEKLRACHVIVDHEEREAIIRDGAAKLAADAGLTLVEDEGLVVENAGLTEWPVPLLGRFDADFLDVPAEVIQLTARINQKYFVMRGEDCLLAPAFICTANVDAKDGGEAIVEGNRRVLAARLSDARFFWEQDLKVPLEEQAKKLSGIVFHEKLGTVADKVDRVAKLARLLVERGFVGAGVNADEVERAAQLSKADLVTGMVGEFPELQGIIGGYLAERQGETRAIADAIRDQYRPMGPTDKVPSAPVSAVLALADKLDTIVAFFGEQMQPSGSKDPFALRRAALGIIRIILENGLRTKLTYALLSASYWRYRQKSAALGDDVAAGIWHGLAEAMGAEPDINTLNEFLSKRDIPGQRKQVQESQFQAVRTLLEFFADRLKVQQREAGVRHDLIDAVFALGGEDDLVRLLARVNALQGFVETGEGTNLLAGYKRAANILKKENWDLPRVMATKGEQGIPQTGEEDPLVLVEEPAIAEAVAEMATGSSTPADAPVEEKALVAALDAAEPKAKAAVEAEDFTAAMAALASLRAPIDAFFDKVTVNDPDKATRARRLNLLARFRDAVHEVADFSKIEG